jgi:hypothetical protein
VALDEGDRDVMVAADDVTSLARDRIATSLSRDRFAGLPSYDEEGTYHLASVGWLRRHLGWVRDSEADEEAG